ncbi:MAG TPA: ABC transporter ATP-binding protein [Solirubrobacteraceae bacterium]|nr:ABC transporter ATP-binding protein [Solirubrobacteraceae bacterium]
MLQISAVSKRFGDVHALEDVSFTVQRGEIVAVIGPNGAGKTTLLSIIAGSLAPSSGRVRTEGGRVGWAPQEPALYSRLSVAENLRLFARLEHVGDPQVAVRRMLAQTGLGERADERVGRLSGGNRQRVNVALALIGEPPVLALDEPSASLDPAQRERLWRFIAGLAREGTTVVFSTHNVNEAQRYAGRTIVLADGRLLFDGPPSELLARASEADADLERALVAFLEERTRASQP